MDESGTYALLMQELRPYKAMLAKASDTILEQDVSDYPIFVAHQEMEIGVGILLADAGQIQGNWSINASSLEEFTTKGLIQPDKIENFKGIYKDPKHYFCVFIARKVGATFVFIPRS